MKSENILEIKNLSVSFPLRKGIFFSGNREVKAVEDFTLNIKRGETIGLVGESGCGKSTVVKAVSNLIKFSAPEAKVKGEINFYKDGNEFQLLGMKDSELKKLRKHIQVVFQDPYSSLNPRMTIGKAIEEPISNFEKISKEEKRERVNNLLDKTGLRKDLFSRYPHELSGGQRQRVVIARALSVNPEVLVADEPVSALDVSIQAQIINLLQDLQEEMNLTIIFVSHDLAVVEHISSEIAVMYLGKIVERGRSEDIFEKPEHPYTRALLSAIPRPYIDEQAKERIVLTGEIPSPVDKPSGCVFRTRCFLADEKCAEVVPELKETTAGKFAACIKL
jgi:oligopeptide transport system ATP-binding protein